MPIDDILRKLAIETYAERLREAEKARLASSLEKTNRLPLILQSLLAIFA